jgi:hypothetical protein
MSSSILRTQRLADGTGGGPIKIPTLCVNPTPSFVCGGRGGAPFDSAANILRDRTIHCLDGIGENFLVEVL